MCVRARDGGSTLVQLTRKFARTNWFGSGRVQNFTFVDGSGRDLGGSGRVGFEKVTRRQLWFHVTCKTSLSINKFDICSF
jgi:hypothetical protein